MLAARWSSSFWTYSLRAYFQSVSRRRSSTDFLTASISLCGLAMDQNPLPRLSNRPPTATATMIVLLPDDRRSAMLFYEVTMNHNTGHDRLALAWAIGERQCSHGATD